MPSLDLAGLRVHYVGRGEPLLLLHGLGSASHAWGPVLGALATRHTVVACDLPGFGSSPPLPAGQLRSAFFAQIRRRPRRLERREAANEVRTTAGRQFALTREVTLDGGCAERL